MFFNDKIVQDVLMTKQKSKWIIFCQANMLHSTSKEKAPKYRLTVARKAHAHSLQLWLRPNSILTGSKELNPWVQAHISDFPRTQLSLRLHCFPCQGFSSKALNDEREQGTHRDCQPQVCPCPCFTDSPATPEAGSRTFAFYSFWAKLWLLEKPRTKHGSGKAAQWSVQR